MRLSKAVRDCGHDEDAIVMAASQIMRKRGHNDCAKVIKAVQDDPTVGKKLKLAIDMDLDVDKPKANHVRTLSLMYRQDQTVEGYEQWRKDVNATVGYNLYPCYKVLAKSKALLRPEVSLMYFMQFYMQA